MNTVYDEETHLIRTVSVPPEPGYYRLVEGRFERLSGAADIADTIMREGSIYRITQSGTVE